MGALVHGSTSRSGNDLHPAARTPPCIVGRFRCWFSSEDENSEPRHGRKQPGVLLKAPGILHGSHHVPHCEGLSDAAAIVRGTRVSTYQVEGTWGGHVTHEPPSGSLHTLCDTNEQAQQPGYKARPTPHWLVFQNRILAAIPASPAPPPGCRRGWGRSGDGERLHKLFIHMQLTITPTSVAQSLAQSPPASGRW